MLDAKPITHIFTYLFCKTARDLLGTLFLQLLCVDPTANALALVYRDEETLQFVKYVTDSVKRINEANAFFDFSFLYLEPQENK